MKPFPLGVPCCSIQILVRFCLDSVRPLHKHFNCWRWSQSLWLVYGYRSLGHIGIPSSSDAPAVRAYVLDRANQGVSARADTLSTRAALRDEIGSPLHLLVTDPNRHHSSAVTRMHVWEGDMPRGAIVDVLPDFDRVRSVAPLLALFGMAPAMSEANLIMALCELCGRFSIYERLPKCVSGCRGLSMQAACQSSMGGGQCSHVRES